MIITGHLPSPHDKVCAASEIFVAEILSAALTDCPLTDPTGSTCHPRDQPTFRVRINEMLAVNSRHLALLKVKAAQPNDNVVVMAELFNSRASDSEAPKDEFGMLKVDHPTGEPLSNAQISKQFIGQTFIVGIRPNPFDPTRPPAASVWAMNQRPWVEDELRRSAPYCSTLVGPGTPP